MLIVIQSANSDDSATFATDFASDLAGKGCLSRCVLPSEKYALAAQPDFKGHPSLDEALIHARHLDFLEHALRVEYCLKRQETVIAVDYYAFGKFDMRSRSGGEIPSVVFHLVSENTLYDNAFKLFCERNGFNYIRTAVKSDINLKMLSVHEFFKCDQSHCCMDDNCQTCGLMVNNENENV